MIVIWLREPHGRWIWDEQKVYFSIENPFCRRHNLSRSLWIALRCRCRRPPCWTPSCCHVVCPSLSCRKVSRRQLDWRRTSTAPMSVGQLGKNETKLINRWRHLWWFRAKCFLYEQVVLIFNSKSNTQGQCCQNFFKSRTIITGFFPADHKVMLRTILDQIWPQKYDTSNPISTCFRSTFSPQGPI